MKTNDFQQELIDQFLRGELRGDVLNNFLSELNSNPELQDAVQTQEEITLGIEHHGNEQLRNRLKDISKETKKRPKVTKSPRRIIHYLIPAAAAIALLLVASIFIFNNDEADFTLDKFEPFDLSITRNGETDNRVAQAERFYKDQNYSRAAPLFEDVLKDNTENSIIELALGNTYIQINKFKEAKVQFQNIIQRNDPLYSDQAKWYLALTFLKNKEVKKGKSILQDLVDDPNADFNKEAKELLNSIK